MTQCSCLCDEHSSSPPPCVPSPSAPLSRSASWEGLSTLPTHGSPLRHVTHVRPRPPRRHRTGHLTLDPHFSENGGVSLLEDGLPDFYTKRVLPDSQLSSHHQAQILRRKKRRSVLSIFSGFRKNRNSTISNQDAEASENVYSFIQHPKDAVRVESTIQGTNGGMPSPRPSHGVPLPGVRVGSPPCHIQRQSSDLVSMVYSCIGADIDSDASSCDNRQSDREMDRQTPETQADTRANGHVASTGGLDKQTDRQMDKQTEAGRQERVSFQTDTRTETEGGQSSEEGRADREAAPCGQKPDPPPQSSKPNLAGLRQRHLQESSDKSPEDCGGVEGEREVERNAKRQDVTQRTRGAEGQRPPIPAKPSKDLSRDSNSPYTSPAVTPPGEVTSEKKTPPPVPPASAKPGLESCGAPVTPEEGTTEKKSPPRVPPMSAKPSFDLPSSAVNQDEDGSTNGGISKPHRNRKANSCDAGMGRDSPSDLERSSVRKPPVKKPRLPQSRNRSLDYPASVCHDSPEPGNSEAS
ncbi:capping protein, Arp2/3 and myosin-I linker protein 3 [Hypomesus transpacificus]|uniref:capping protein, Arp2/3 and myosin-I linker protein 3 n=1 Tax=Hypomesus transpacificus TaxID=137520 RepID=UPI001F075C31|nr:capping protein, Arp2/3 and myosin-I linker protein 3 [Hypomesus transpacificus]